MYSFKNAKKSLGQNFLIDNNILNKIIGIASSDINKDVLEIGAGRGYTCYKLSPYVKSLIGVEVAESSLLEAKELISKNKIENVLIKQVSANNLTKHFEKNEFDVALSIDVVEHLHPEDAEEHYRQVFEILKPNGKYIIIMPNRLTGPHDITRTVFPESKEPLGFHLNESTYKETKRILRLIGYKKFYALFSSVLVPVWIILLIERLYEFIPKKIFSRILNPALSIRLVAKKM